MKILRNTLNTITISLLLSSGLLFCSDNSNSSYLTYASNLYKNFSSPEEHSQLTEHLAAFDRACEKLTYKELTDAIRNLATIKHAYSKATIALIRRGVFGGQSLRQLCDTEALCNKAYSAFLQDQITVPEFKSICDELPLLTTRQNQFLGAIVFKNAQKIGTNKLLTEKIVAYVDESSLIPVAISAIKNSEDVVKVLIDNKPKVFEDYSVIDSALEKLNQTFKQHKIISSLKSSKERQLQSSQEKSATKDPLTQQKNITQLIMGYLVKCNKLPHEMIHGMLAEADKGCIFLFLDNGYNCKFISPDKQQSSLDFFVAGLAESAEPIRPTDEDIALFDYLEKKGARLNAEGSQKKILALYDQASRNLDQNALKNSHHLMGKYIEHIKQ